MPIPFLSLSGDVGAGIPFLSALLLVLVGLGVFFLAWAIYSTRHPRNADRPPAWYQREPLYVLVVASVFIAFWAFTLPFVPLVSSGKMVPVQTIDVQAQQFAWSLNSTALPVNKPVMFHVTSKDVTHGFGVYDASGALIFQQQVMPGYPNDFTYTFRQTGVYTIRCIEYCGFGHPTMIATFVVVNA